LGAMESRAPCFIGCWEMVYRILLFHPIFGSLLSRSEIIFG
jgi:hypothetical protein